MAKKKTPSDDTLGLSGIQAARMAMEERAHKEKADSEERQKQLALTMESFKTMDAAIMKMKENTDQIAREKLQEKQRLKMVPSPAVDLSKKNKYVDVDEMKNGGSKRWIPPKEPKDSQPAGGADINCC